MCKAFGKCKVHRQIFVVALILLGGVRFCGVAAASAPRKLPLSPDQIAPPPPAGIGHPGIDIRSLGERLEGGPVVNISARHDNQAETTIAINPTNPDNIVAFSNEQSANAIFRACSFDGGLTWAGDDILFGACCDGQAVFDSFGNLFLVDIGSFGGRVDVVVSTDGGLTFPTSIAMNSSGADQPSIAVGDGSVWVDWNLNGSMVARGARVTGLGQIGPFGLPQTIPGASGSFGGIAVGPGPNGGKVIVTYQNPYGDEGPSTIYVNVDEDGLGPRGFGPRVTVTTTNVGGFDYIPAQSGRSIDAEAGLVWDRTGGVYDNRIYLVYTDETVNENNDTDIMVRTSTDDGQTWSDPVRVNDDPSNPIRSQFLPYIALDPTTGTVAAGWYDCRNDNGVPGSGGTNNIPNDDAEYFASYSTDGGATWAPNARLSGGFSNAAMAAGNVDYGDFIGTTAYGGVFRPTWADNSNSTGDNPDGTLHRFDIYTAAFPIGNNSADVASGTGKVQWPSRLVLSSPSPNPVFGSVSLAYGLPEEGRVRLTVHDVSGRQVATLFDGERPAGWHSVTWDGHRDSGGRMAAGVYFVRITGEGQTRVQRMIVMQ
jgi:hypothetical protein